MLKRIFAIHTLQIYKLFFTFSRSQIRILARRGKKWARTNVIFHSLHTLFFHFSHPQIQISGILVKNGVGPPLFIYIFSYFLIKISARFEKRWSWTPTGCISICDSLCVWAYHTPMRFDHFDGSGSKRYVTNICCTKC